MLLPEINEKMTRRNVMKLLEQYHSLRRLAGRQYEQKLTASYTLEPKGDGGTSKPVEDMVTRKVSAIEIINHIHDALNKLNGQQRKLLWEHYTISAPSEYEIVTKFNISVATYYRKLEKAQLAFAEVYHLGELIVEM
ncbi:ArpU family phage packaging/lysis transcriptional regulator [Ruoffia sp. FAM 24228]|uniref:ArpU family phage packaging/lysis transcriptional regulator n=1 Tax=Ruoffia sp. FAM 24228 TaxID=3259517 RepID=UPI00388BA7EF